MGVAGFLRPPFFSKHRAFGDGGAYLLSVATPCV